MEWISVKERLPEFETKVKVKMSDGTETTGFVNDNPQRTCWMTERDGAYWRSFINTVTHFMPLPDPPKEFVEQSKTK